MKKVALLLTVTAACWLLVNGLAAQATPRAGYDKQPRIAVRVADPPSWVMLWGKHDFVTVTNLTQRTTRYSCYVVGHDDGSGFLSPGRYHDTITGRLRPFAVGETMELGIIVTRVTCTSQFAADGPDSQSTRNFNTWREQR